MKNLIILMLSCFGFASMAIAQNDNMISKEASAEMADYERYFDKVLEMEYRKSTIEALGMTSKEIEEFSPIFENYMEDKQELAEKRIKLLEDLKEELAENDSKKNEDDDKADFIEAYLELNIDATKLKKKYFDEMEDEISLEKATKFLLWEDMMDERMNRRTIIQIIPVPNYKNDMSINKYNSDNENDRGRLRSTTDSKEEMVNKGHKESKKMRSRSESNSSSGMNDIKTSIDGFNTWISSTDGEVDLSHDYTYDGVQGILSVLSVMNENKALNISSFDTEKENIMNMVVKLKDDPMSDKHADIAQNTFMSIAKLMNNNSALTKAASKINTNVLMTKQASNIKNFFKVANTQLQNMSHSKVKSERSMNDK